MVVLNAGNPGTLTGTGNNTYLLDGAVPTLVDAGVGNPEHVESIAKHLDGRPLARVLVTHGHPDHASGVPALRSRWPHLEAWKWPHGSDGEWKTLTDGQRIQAGDDELTVVYTPGHAADHVCFWHAKERGLFCGDMMTRTTTIMIPPAARGGSLRAYLDSLRRLAALGPLVAWPGHGEVIDAPVRRIEQTLQHRAERQAQVQACLDDGETGLDAIVARVYADVPKELWPAARLTVESLLEMLNAETGE